MAHANGHSNGDESVSPRTQSSPTWPARTELPAPFRTHSVRPQQTYLAGQRYDSDQNIDAVYNASDDHVHVHNLHRPSEATITVNEPTSPYGPGPRLSSASSITVKPAVEHLTNATGPKSEDVLGKGSKNFAVVPIFDPAYTDINWQFLEMDTPEPEPLSIPPPSIPAPNLAKFRSPLKWSYARKMMVTIVSSWATCLAADATGSYNSPDDILMEKWGVNQVTYELGLTIFCIGFALTPMVLAPFSEINGRRPLFIASGSILAIASVGCGFVNTYAEMMVGRLFAGIGASTFSSVVGGVISDMYGPAERNTPMALFSAGALMGTGIGPLYTNFIVTNASWRWVFWAQGIVVGATVLYLIFCFPETRASVLLSKKAKALNKWYEQLEKAGIWGVMVHPGPGDVDGFPKVMRVRFKTVGDEERKSLWKMISISCYRPCHMLVTEPVVFFFSLWVAFAWAVLYLQFGAIPLVFKTVYNFNKWQCGLVFSAICVGTTIGYVISIWQEKVLRRRWPERANSVEGRLFWACFESILLPTGLFWFGWTAKGSIHWILPTIGIVLSSMGIFSIYLSCFNFLTDAYHIYASSALAAQSGCRNILGGVFPLVTTQMFNNLGFAEASSVLEFAGFMLSFVPWALMVYGPDIRARSKMFCAHVTRD